MSKSNHWVPPLILLLLLVIAGTGCTAKMKAAYHQKRADQFYAAGQFDQAEIEYKNVLQHAPQNARAWSRLGLIYFDEGRLGEAAKTLSQAAQLAPDNVPVRLKLGSIYLSAGKFKEARDAAGFVLGKDPRNAQAPILLAEAAISTNEINQVRLRLQSLSQSGKTAPLEIALGTLSFRLHDLKTAKACFEDAVQLDPKSWDGYSALGNLYLAQKDVKPADQAFKTAMELAPPRSGKALLYAQFKILTGDPDGAKDLLQAMVKKTPDYLPAWITLAELAGAEKDYSGGVALLGNVLSRDPRSPEALLLKGRLEMEQRETARAIKDFEDLARYFPNLPTAYYQLAQAQSVINDFDKAAANLNQALKLNPSYAEASLLLAEVQIYTGKAETAMISLQQLIRRQPQFIPARFMLATAYTRQERFDDAIQVYRELEKSFPTNSQIPLLIGTTRLQQKKYTEAREAFDQALKVAPDSLPALEQEVNLDLMEKKYDSALQRVQQPIEQNPRAAALKLLLARIQIARGETDQAENTLKKIIAMSPDSQPAYLMLARLYSTAHENQKALAGLSPVLAKNPQDIEALLLSGIIYTAEKKYDDARDAYEKLLAVDTNNIMALNNLACLYAQNFGQLDQGYQLARHARDLAPADAPTADTLGWILYQQGQYSSALSLLRESTAKFDADPEVQFHLGMTYYMMGDEANARAAFQRALQLSPDFSEQNECNQCLAVLGIDPKTAGADKLTLLEQRVASQPKDSLAWLRLAAIYQRVGTPDKAIAAYETVLQTSPQNVPALVNLAGLYASQNPQKALNLAKAAYKLAPSNPQVAHTLGRLAFLTGDQAWSLNLLQLAARNQPQDPEVLYDLAQSFYSVGRVSDARSAMQNALQAGTTFSRADDARRLLAMTGLLEKPEQVMAAQSQVANILNSDPDYVPALMVKAAIAEQKPDPATAQQIYEIVLNHYPDFSPAQKALVVLYAKDAKNDAKAYPLAVKARQAFLEDPEVAKALGIIVFRRGDYPRAENLLQESAQKLNRDAELLYYLGVAEYQLKHTALCKTAMQQALDLNLSGAQAVDARRILAELK